MQESVPLHIKNPHKSTLGEIYCDHLKIFHFLKFAVLKATSSTPARKHKVSVTGINWL